jgi:DNA polymerase III subunit delta'
MDYSAFPWHADWLVRARALTSAYHHAWLVVGRTGDGVGQAASALAASLLCAQPVAAVACGQCPSCRWLACDVHPDFRKLAPDAGDGETVKLPTIKVDAVREALEFMQLSAAGEQGRVLLVDPATALPRESANALLKALEEPPPNTRWLLVAAQPERLLPTIRSRALKLAVPAPQPAEAVLWLQGQGLSSVSASVFLQQSRGEPVVALAASMSESGGARDEFVRDLLRPGQLPTLKWGAWLDAGPKAERRERFATLLRILLDWTSDWARVRAQLVPRVFVNEHKGLADLAAQLPMAEALRYHRSLLKKLQLPDTTLSARLQFESVLLDYRALFAR